MTMSPLLRSYYVHYSYSISEVLCKRSVTFILWLNRTCCKRAMTKTTVTREFYRSKELINKPVLTGGKYE